MVGGGCTAKEATAGRRRLEGLLLDAAAAAAEIEEEVRKVRDALKIVERRRTVAVIVAVIGMRAAECVTLEKRSKT
jgi:hypothetical protein